MITNNSFIACSSIADMQAMAPFPLATILIIYLDDIWISDIAVHMTFYRSHMLDACGIKVLWIPGG